MTRSHDTASGFDIFIKQRTIRSLWSRCICILKSYFVAALSIHFKCASRSVTVQNVWFCTRNSAEKTLAGLDLVQLLIFFESLEQRGVLCIFELCVKCKNISIFQKHFGKENLEKK